MLNGFRSRSSRFGRRSVTAGCALAAAAGFARAGDVTWDNGSSDMVWNTSSLNWSGAAWNNANGDGAVFNGSGLGPISVPGPITVQSLNFTSLGYSLNGPGPVNLTSSGTSTLGAGVVSTDVGVTAVSNAPISGTSIGLTKLGAGTLQIGAGNSFAGLVSNVFASGGLSANVQIGTSAGIGYNPGGTLTLLDPASLPASTNFRLTAGTLDLGSNNVTISSLTFPNVGSSLGVENVIGTGTLRVTGDIHVLGAGFGGGGGGATIYTPVDLGGGTQIVRIGTNGGLALEDGCRFFGPLTNGSLLTTIGLTQGGTLASVDGLSLLADNTYTGPTVFNTRTNMVTATNQTTSVTTCGGSTILRLANGSFGNATSLRVFGTGVLSLDSNGTVFGLTDPAAENNNRIRDDAAVELRDGSFTFIGLSGSTTASETFGSMAVTGGHNTLTITPTNAAGGALATVTCAGAFTMSSRATVAVSTPAAVTSPPTPAFPIGGSPKFLIGGAVPAADATGILPRMVGTNGSADFLTYNPVTGLTPYTGYATDFSTPGTNVALTASTALPGSVAINALKVNPPSTGATTTIGAGNTLTVNSGMVYSAGFNTHTIAAGGTLAFGSNPGVFLASGTNIVNAAITGTQGLISGMGTLTLTGDLSGLSGTMTLNSGTTNLGTATFTGPIEVRYATLKPTVPLTGPGGTITLGISAMDANLFSGLSATTLDFSNAACTTIDRNILIDAGTQNAAGTPLSFSLMTKFTPLSNTSGSQTLNGNITLNSPLNLQGGGAGNGVYGATNFTGAISGPGLFCIPNGRVNFTGTSSLSNAGGLLLSNGGFSAIISLLGTASGSAPIVINGGNQTALKYAGASSLFTGPITVQNASGTTAPRFYPLSTSTINNQINLNGDVCPVVAGGITATWAGPITGASAINKIAVTITQQSPNPALPQDNTGTLVLSSGSNSYTGAMSVGAGTLVVNGSFPGASATATTTASPAAVGTLAGTGTIGGAVTVATGGTLAPGNGGAGTINTGNLTVNGALACDVASGAADMVNVTGTVTLGAASVLNLAVSGTPSGQFIIVKNDGSDPVSGTFATVNGLPAGATINYAFTGTDSLGRVGDGNDIAVVLTQPCYANCDASTQPPVLNVADFTCFLQKYAAGDPYANCDASTQPPVLNVADFTCFLQKYAAGCP
jgi:autotransporter-associated beta strand protein